MLEEPRPLPKFECHRCGMCCIILWGSFEATQNDLKRWRREGRDDILKHVTMRTDGASEWGEFTTKACPFLRKLDGKYLCSIHETKPEHCRNYPVDGICLRMEEELNLVD